MKYTRLGRSGLVVSRICFGTMSFGTARWRPWVLEEAESRPFYERALELGINFFDSADVYSDGESERITGKMLREMMQHREHYVLATKFMFGTEDRTLPNRSGGSRKNIIAACEASLRRLGVDYIDLYQMHRYDFRTPYEETLEALHHLVSTGKVLYVGASSMQAWQFARYLYRADALGAARFVSMQNHYNLLYREEEREMMPLCVEEGIGVIPWSPLARGFLSGNRFGGSNSGQTSRAETDEFSPVLYSAERDQEVAAANVAVAERLGHAPSQVALAWLLSRPGVTAPIVGFTKMEHLEQAAQAVDLELSAADVEELEKPYRPHPELGTVTRPRPQVK